MKKVINIFLDKSFLIFLLIGGANTILSLSIQFFLYSVLDFGYWWSSAIAFTLCSVISFYFNKKYSFKNEDRVVKTALKFSLTIAICYLFAYSIAQPIAKIFIGFTQLAVNNELIDKIALLVAQVVFTLMNYIGQRFFAFKK